MEIIYSKKVREFLFALDFQTANKAWRVIDYLKRYGYDLDMPKSKPLGRGLFELRTTGDIQVRMFYCFHDGRAHLLHAIIKKRMSIPYSDIIYARKAMRVLVAR